MHKTIGILGGMSPESTVAYYEHITRAYVKRYGDCSYPRILIYSVSFQTYIDWPREGRWDLVADGLSKAAQVLEAAGADLVLIATNTMHLVFDEVEASVGIPVLSLLDAVGEMVQGRHLTTVGLLGTRFTMETTLYPEALAERGISVLVPDPEDRALVDRVIYDELIAGQICDSSRNSFIGIIDRLQARGAEGVILGCTEIPLLLSEKDVDLPLFDTTVIHADVALMFAVEAWST